MSKYREKKNQITAIRKRCTLNEISQNKTDESLDEIISKQQANAQVNQLNECKFRSDGVLSVKIRAFIGR